MDATLYVSKLEAVGAVDIEEYIDREVERMQELTVKAELAKQKSERGFCEFFNKLVS